MGEGRHDGLAIPGRLILAHEPPFRLGQTFVHPANRQIERDAQRETLEPRVMQVLVALARAGGGIVTRDELNDSCWDGRVVGDDSINRVLSRIRRVAADFGGFTVETITKVGYRLVQAEPVDPQPVAAMRSRVAPAVDRRMLIAGTAALATLGLAGAALWRPFRRGEGSPPEARSLLDRALAVRQEDNRQALAYLREAVRISPDFGEAWGALALCYAQAIEEEAPERVAGFDQRFREAVRNAERFDPGNADAAAAMLPFPRFGQWSQFEPVYRSAIRRHPGHPAAYSTLGSLLMDVGRWSDAVAAVSAAKSRNPSSAVIRYKLTVSLWAAGRISAAEDEIDAAMNLWPQHGAIWQTKIKLLALTGRPQQALALASDPAARPLDEKDAPNMRGRLLYLTALATRDKANVDRAIDDAVTQVRQVGLERLNAALQLTTLGETGLALDMIEGALLGAGPWAVRAARGPGPTTHPLFQPHAEPLWRQPRFNRILSAVGLERYWQVARTLPDYRRG